MSYLPEVSMPPTQPSVEALQEPPTTTDIPTPTALRPNEASPDEKYEVDGDGEPVYDDEGGMTFTPDLTDDVVAPELVVKEIIQDEVIFKPKVKRKATEKQKEHLAKAREKALATRRANAEKKKAERELIQNQKDLKKQERMEKLRIKEEQKELKQVQQQIQIKKQAPPPAPAPQPTFTQEDILKIQEQAISNYETKRKAKKEAKKKALDQEQHDKKVYQAISKAIKPRSVWDDCFS